MYQVKAQGRNGICFFDPVMQARATANVARLRSCARVSGRGSSSWHDQPQVGPEGLMVEPSAMRWNHPERGLPPPSLFTSQAEEAA